VPPRVVVPQTKRQKRLLAGRARWEKNGHIYLANTKKAAEKKAAAKVATAKRLAALRRQLDASVSLTAELPVVDATGIKGAWQCRKCTNMNVPTEGSCSVCSHAPKRKCVELHQLEKRACEAEVPHESDWSECDRETEDGTEEAFDIVDEKRIKKLLRPPLKCLSKSRQNAILNMEYWDREQFNEPDGPTTVTLEHLEEGALLLFVPKDGVKASTLTRYLNMGNKESRRMYLGKMMFAIQRKGGGQVYAAKALHKTPHGAKARKGIEGLVDDGFDFDMLGNSQNHFFQPGKPSRPVVLNCHERVTGFSTFLLSLLSLHLVSILDHTTMDKERGLVVLNVGITSVQNRWWTSRSGVRMPGTMSAMDAMPPELKKALGEAAIMLASIVRDEGNIKADVPFFPPNEHRRVLLD
jgi:hypothetical protein